MKKLTLQVKFERNLAQYRFFNTSETVVIAVSTGIDSMVLLELFLRLPAKQRPKIVVAHVNHELRSQSDQEEQFIRSFCARHQLELVVKHWPQAQHPDHGIEAAARTFRYRFFAAVLQQKKARIVVTAHQANDQAETMLMKLVRGGQLTQLTGIATQRDFLTGKLVRPLLNVSRDEIKAFAQRERVTWFEDITNTDLSIQRNRFRHQIIPRLQAENPAVVAHLNDYQLQLTQLMAFAHNQVQQIMRSINTDQNRLDLASYRRLDQSGRPLVLQQWLEQNQQIHDISQTQLAAMDQMLVTAKRPQAVFKLNEQTMLIKEYQQAWVRSSDWADNSITITGTTVLELNQWQKIKPATRIGIFTPAKLKAVHGDQAIEMWLPKAAFPLKLRRWQLDDVLQLKNGHHQKVRRILIDNKVENQQRRLQLVVVDQADNVIWLVGQKMSWFKRPLDYQTKWQHVVFVKRFDRGE